MFAPQLDQDLVDQGRACPDQVDNGLTGEETRPQVLTRACE
jgi:hypothetical protein